jgi:hypothetical protein
MARSHWLEVTRACQAGYGRTDCPPGRPGRPGCTGRTGRPWPHWPPFSALGPGLAPGCLASWPLAAALADLAALAADCPGR